MQCNEVFTPNLKTIAAWTLPLSVEEPSIIASIPALQRGLVWKPSQIELFWDSALRGFPLGAFVVCRNLGDYHTSYLRPTPSKPTHSLLDGQQRAQAIAVGFQDPFALNPADIKQILWIDLKPNSEGNKTTTRSFVLRLTNKAHPWGFALDDEATPISNHERSEHLKRMGLKTPLSERPAPIDCWPSRAEVPIPLAWLLHCSGIEGEAAWGMIRNRCNQFQDKVSRLDENWSRDKHWSEKAVELLDKEESTDARLKAILAGVRRAQSTKILCLETLHGTLENDPESNESGKGSASHSQIDDAELLFNRLNTKGTPLNGEELSWSLIKARSPELEKPIDNLVKLSKVPAARLATLAARIPLVEKREITTPVSIADFRRFARQKDDVARQEGNATDIHKIYEFLVKDGATDLPAVLRRVNAWLGRSEDDDGLGLPPVLQASVARRSSGNVYALLLWLASQSLKSSPGAGTPEEKALRKPILALTTTLHWFGADDRRRIVAKVVDCLNREMGKVNGLITPRAFVGLLSEAERCVGLTESGRVGVYLPPNGDELRRLVGFPEQEPEVLKGWTLYHQATTCVPSGRDEAWAWKRLKTVFFEREILLYAQRSYLTSEFQDYDPTDLDTWAEHDRPWDFDHILPTNKFHGNASPAYPEAVKEWAGSIGNLRAWDLVLNRSRQDKPLMSPHSGEQSDDKFSKQLEESYISRDELDGFERGYSNMKLPEGAVAFATAASKRLLRIYDAWFGSNGLDVAKLISPP